MSQESAVVFDSSSSMEVLLFDPDPVVPRPSQETWEAIRPLITKLWFDEGKVLEKVLTALQAGFNLKITPKPLKTKLSEWGLLKKLNSLDAEDIVTAHTKLENENYDAIVLLRGRVESLKHAQQYQKRRLRRARKGNDLTQTPKSLRIARSRISNVIAISLHPTLRPAPALNLLKCLETLLREQSLLLQRAHAQGRYEVSNTSILWTNSTENFQVSERQFEYTIRESARAYSEGNVEWAGLCWRSALLQVEDLVTQPDLDFWTNFLRSCLLLARQNAIDVVGHFLERLRWLRGRLPFTAPHRCLVYALTDLSPEQLIQGGIFILEAKLRDVQSIWPQNPAAHVTYQLQLAEERFCQTFRSYYKGLPEKFCLNTAFDETVSRDTLNKSGVTMCAMLFRNYDEAEMHLQRNIAGLERSIEMRHQRVPSIELLATYYWMLGTVQYYQELDTAARVSYTKCLELNEECFNFCRSFVLDYPRIYRLLTLLEWLESRRCNPGNECVVADYQKGRTDIENHVSTMLETRSSQPMIAYATKPSGKRGILRSTSASKPPEAVKRQDFPLHPPASFHEFFHSLPGDEEYSRDHEAYIENEPLDRQAYRSSSRDASSKSAVYDTRNVCNKDQQNLQETEVTNSRGDLVRKVDQAGTILPKSRGKEAKRRDITGSNQRRLLRPRPVIKWC